MRVTKIVMYSTVVVAFYDEVTALDKRVLGVREAEQGGRFQFYPQYDAGHGQWLYWLGERSSPIYSDSLDWAMDFIENNRRPEL